MTKLQILGTGCAKCERLAEHTEEASQALGLDYELVKVTDLLEITKFGVMMMPALVVWAGARPATACASNRTTASGIRKNITVSITHE